jgi:alpha-beta hydrolase superfamily lysophospholipase
MTHHALRTADGLALHRRGWSVAAGVPHGTVLIVHGLGEHSARYDALAHDLNAAGWQVASYDQRGHGRSEGARGVIAADDSLLQDLATVVRHLRCPAAPDLSPGPLVLLGHSMGGAVAARFMAPGADGGVGEPAWRDAAQGVDALVLSSPALRLPMNAAQRLLLAATANTLPNIALGNGLKPEWICSDPHVVAAYKADPLVHDRISPRLVRFMIDAGQTVRERAAHWRVPTLLMWAGADRCVDAAGCAELGARAPAALLSHRAWDAMSHEIFNEPQRGVVVQALLTWLETRKVSQQAALN